MRSIRLIALPGILAGFASVAEASPRCQVPLEAWQPRQALEDKLKAQGWTIRRIKTDDGCYKVDATRADGQRTKATFAPDTLTLIREKQHDD